MNNKTKERLFEKEFYPLVDALYNFAFRLTLNETDADDLVQDTFLKAWRFIDSFQKGTNAKAWLFRILRNSFINEYRRKVREPNKVDYEAVEDYYNNREDDRISAPSDLRVELFSHLMGDEVTRALNELEVDFRLIILLCDVEEFTYEEISKILDIPIGTVRSRLHRGRTMMKEKLREYAKTQGFKEKEDEGSR